MANFREKCVFIWNNHIIEGGDPARIIARLREAGFEGAYLHSTHTTNWRTSTRITLARALKAAGFAVYASVAVYAKLTLPTVEGQQAASIVNEYGLDGCVFDVESGEYETTGAEARVRALLSAYKANTAKPSAFCGWPFYHASNNPSRIYHPVGVLVEAMKIADYAMPMAYPSGDNNTPAALAYLDAVWRQWRTYTTKPMVIAGRACNDNAGQANAASIVPYALRARELGAVGMSWWDMEHALPLPGVWDALAETPPISGNAGEPEPPGKDDEMTWVNNAIGLYTKTAGWTNKDFNFIVGYAGGDWSERGPNDWRLEPNQSLKAIEEQAHAEGKPFLALWDFDVSAYSLAQIDANEAKWPAEAADYPLQALIGALQNRAVDGLIIRVMTGKNRLGGEEKPEYVAFAAQKFVERANRWLYTTKGVDKWTFVLTNDSFLRTKGAQESYYRWTKDLWLGIEQEATRPLDKNAWPQPGDKIKAVPPSLGWKIWYHHNAASLDMMIWNGTNADMRAFLNFKPSGTPGGGGDNPPPPPPGVYVTVTAFNEAMAAANARMVQLEAKHAADVAALLAKIPTGATITLTHG